MNKLKVGMWIRTDEGIRKILSEHDEGYELDESLHYLYPEGHDLYKDIMNDVIIGEPSFNIIDLIEVGDYVNGGQVREKKEGYIRLSGGKSLWSYLDTLKDIKSIVTKEQFKSMEYKVGDSNE